MESRTSEVANSNAVRLLMKDSNPEKEPADETAVANRAKVPSSPKKSESKRTGNVSRARARWTTRRGLKEIKAQVPSWVTSLILHVAALFALAFITLPLGKPPELSLQATRVVEETFEIEDDLLDLEVDLEQDTLEETIDQQLEAEPQAEVLAEAFEAQYSTPLEAIAEVVDFGAAITDLGDISEAKGMASSGLQGRGSAGKASLLRSGGGTKSSEKAVQAGLEWIARHQYPDGSWNFDHSQSECEGRCGNPGTFREARAAATGLALLAYLGAGHTQEDGRYKRVVYRGIYALGNMMKVDKNGGSFHEPQGNMYSHGIATMAICEAYAMTGDPALREPAQAAINFVCYAQDPSGGGWRYNPKQPGDTSVMGWQLGALKSGYLSKLYVPSGVINRAAGFLDSVASKDGLGYQYTPDGENAKAKPATTAIGLLCRMYLGTSHDDAGIKAGIDYLSKRGPSKTDVYYNYYTTQALFHYTGGKGPIWKKWNEKTRNMLVETQEKEGHAAGSWTPIGNEKSHNARAGRLFTTALSTMTLEVYYRMLPIYREKAVADEFKFEK